MRALDWFPRFKEAHVNLAQAHKDLGDLASALQHFDRVRRVMSVPARRRWFLHWAISFSAAVAS